MGVDLLILGADGMDPRLLEYMKLKRYVPTINSIVAETANIGKMSSRVGSQSIPHTGPAWTTIYTGLTEREHGVTQGGWLLGDVSLIPHFENTIFSEMTTEGYSIGSFTMPITYPAQTADDGDSWMVSGFPAVTDAPEKIVAPSSVESYLPDDFDKVQARELLHRDKRHEPVSKWIDAERKKVNEVLPRFIEHQPVDVVCYGTQIIDAMCHRVHPYPRYPYAAFRRLYKAFSHMGWSFQMPRIATIAVRKEVRLAYQEIDNILKSLIELTNPERILLVSDHGFSLDGQEHSFVGTSLTEEMVRRPEHIAEVPSVVYESLGINSKTRTVSEIDRSGDTLSDDEQKKVKEQMASLGYLDDT